MAKLTSIFKNNYRTTFAVAFLALVFYFSKHQSYMLFHTVVELFSIVVAFAVFIVTWNSRKMQDNKYLHLVGISYIFIGALDLLHTLSYNGMTVISTVGYPANQFWIATRFLEASTLLIGFFLFSRRKKLNSDLIFLIYFFISTAIMLSILVFDIFPVCYIEGMGQTPFKISAEYLVIAILLISAFLLVKNQQQFSLPVYRLLFASIIFTILSEFCFTLYVSNYSTANELGHYAKLIAFFLIYKANVETGFIKPTDLIFKNLTESEKKYRTLAENLPGVILRFDQHMNCIYSNVAGQESSKDIHAIQIQATHGETSLLQLLLPVLDKARQSTQLQSSSFQMERNGEQLFYAVQVIPEYTSAEEDSSYLVICQDVTTLKSTEHQLHALNQTKDKLFSIIAHDLKNPFTSLLSFSELIHKNADKLDRSKIEHMAGRMNESAKQAYALLENLLNWSRIQTGLLKPVPVAIQVSDLLAEARKLSEPLALSKNISLNFTSPGGLFILADQQMAATVLRNLISNAVKFSFPGSSIMIKAEEALPHIRFSVSDTGIGISEEHREHLLETGNTFSTPGTAAEHGTGLGLVLCREFVEINDGLIWLKSEFGVGTTFYFTLPSA